jgi:hypothetical protein
VLSTEGHCGLMWIKVGTRATPGATSPRLWDRLLALTLTEIKLEA